MEGNAQREQRILYARYRKSSHKGIYNFRRLTALMLFRCKYNPEMNLVVLINVSDTTVPVILV